MTVANKTVVFLTHESSQFHGSIHSHVNQNDTVFFFSRTTKFGQYTDKRRFRFYMVYGWGLSLLLTLAILVLGYTKPFTNYPLPAVDINTCFLQSMNNYIAFDDLITKIKPFLFFRMK